MEEAAVHGGALEIAECAAVGVGEEGFGSMGGDDLVESDRDLVEGIVPGDGFELGRALGTGAAEGCGEAIGVILTLEVASDFGAEEALGDGVGRVTAKMGGFAVLDGN
jgi:hypothetical protein